MLPQDDNTPHPDFEGITDEQRLKLLSLLSPQQVQLVQQLVDILKTRLPGDELRTDGALSLTELHIIAWWRTLNKPTQEVFESVLPLLFGRTGDTSAEGGTE